MDTNNWPQPTVRPCIGSGAVEESSHQLQFCLEELWDVNDASQDEYGQGQLGDAGPNALGACNSPGKREN